MVSAALTRQRRSSDMAPVSVCSTSSVQRTALRHRGGSGISGKRARRLFNLFGTAISSQREAVTWSRATNTQRYEPHLRKFTRTDLRESLMSHQQDATR